MGFFKLIGYHGTDASVSDEIIENGFISRYNDEHWLGQGIYLYLDRSLAEWWTTNPTEKHGTTITHPTIIACTIEVEERRVLNLCTLNGYRKYVDLFNSFLQDWVYSCRPVEEISFKKLRCIFFNFIFQFYQIDMIIAPFLVPNQPYMPKYSKEPFGQEMHILYTEIQICIREDRQAIITEKKSS